MMERPLTIGPFEQPTFPWQTDFQMGYTCGMYSMKEKSLSFICSVPNSSSGLIYVKIWAESSPIFSKNPGGIQADF